MLKNCSLSNIIWTKRKTRNWEVGQDFFQTSNYIRAIFWKSIECIYIFVIFFIACAIQYHRSVFIFIVRRILSTQLSLNISGHSLPTKLYIDPYTPTNVPFLMCIRKIFCAYYLVKLCRTFLKLFLIWGISWSAE